MPHAPAQAFDADNHYYEATDAFTRHIDPKMARRAMQWAEVGGKTRLLVGGKINRFIPNPTFDPVSKPGALIDYFRGKAPIDNLADGFGELDPIHPEYREPAARVKVMDEQGLEGAFLFPTLGVGMEQALEGDPPALMAAFGAFNRWLEEDWSFDYQGRLFAAPYITLTDVDFAISELEFALDHGARLINMRPAPVRSRSGNRSLGHPDHDPFWARVNESGITVAMHAGDASYGFMLEAWGADAEFQAFRLPPLFQLLTMSPISDAVAAFIADGIFTRFPSIRLATIENGSDWVVPLTWKLRKVAKMRPDIFTEHPMETLRRHVWVSPFYEDNLVGLAELIGVDRMLFGSDWPHAEGLRDPLSYVDDLAEFSQEDIDKIMYSNAAALARPST
jgi:predicted TIM-barrel fold metal-dependent hydrolase